MSIHESGVFRVQRHGRPSPQSSSVWNDVTTTLSMAVLAALLIYLVLV
jgi:hypothetical protein